MKSKGLLGKKFLGNREREIEIGAPDEDPVIVKVRAFGVLQICGTAGHVEVGVSDTFYAFEAQLLAFVDYFRTARRPFPFSEIQGLMKMVIAGIRSRDEGGREVMLSKISAYWWGVSDGRRRVEHETESCPAEAAGG